MEGLKEQFSKLFDKKKTPTLSHCLGIYLSSEAAYICEIQKGGNKPSIKQMIKVPFSPSREPKEESLPSALKTQFFSDPGQLATLLRTAMDKTSWGSRQVVVSLAPQLSILRHFIMPKMERKFWKQSIPIEARKYIPVSLNDVTYDFQVRVLPPDPDGRVRMSVLFGVVHQKVLDSVKEMVEKLGLTLLSVEPAICSVGRFWEMISPEPASSAGSIWIHYDTSNTYLQISQQGVPLLSRELFSMGDMGGTDRRKVDLAGSLDFVKKQMPHVSFKSVCLTGVQLDTWKTSLAKESGLSVQALDVGKSLGLKSVEWVVLASVGAAWRCLTSPVLILDFVNLEKGSEEIMEGALVLWKVGFVIAGFYVFLSLFYWGQMFFYKRELQKVLQKSGAVQNFKGQTIDQIEVMVQEMRKRVDVLDYLFSESGATSQKMQQLADNIPDAVWIKKLDYTSNLNLSSNVIGGKRMEMDGLVLGADVAEAITIADGFKKKLEENEVFKRDFQRCDFSFSRANAGASGERGFSLSCGRKT
ncbi:MAG: pilus assembly protein PilM [Elusimicrobia bacterium]|nr:pilus assembly protein PilM [Elusimicrobiota bacterium]